MTLSRSILAFWLALLLLGGCNQGTSRTADGAPVGIEFVELVGPVHRLKARVRYVNHTERDVRSVRSTFRFLDKTGKTLKEMPWAQTSDPVVAGEGKSEHDVGTYVPEETVDLEANVSLVVFADGEMWRPKKQQ
jgi:hypothetical protein